MLMVTKIDTPLGAMLAAAGEQGLRALDFADLHDEPLVELRRLAGQELTAGEHPMFDRLRRELTEYFGGRLRQFNLPLDLRGTVFQQRVWQVLQSIPYGQTFSYQQQALTLGQPTAVRAVASCNAVNPVAIIVPCHRVIGKNGALTGYAGGLWRKQRLLELEGILQPALS